MVIHLLYLVAPKGAVCFLKAFLVKEAMTPLHRHCRKSEHISKL